MSEMSNDDFRESFHNFLRKGGAEDTAELFKRPFDEQLAFWEEGVSGDGTEQADQTELGVIQEPIE